MKVTLQNILTFAATSSLIVAQTAAFAPIPSNTPSLIVSRGSSSTTTSLAAKRPIKTKVQRDWSYTEENGDTYEADGDISLKVFLPENGEKVKGCAFFMHGFSQYTTAYSETLQRVADNSNVAVISADTGISSRIVLGTILSNLFEMIKNREYPQFVLQRALSEDTKQIIRMISNGDEAFKEFNIGKNVPKGVCGHSMGGGLSFPVAADSPGVNYVFTMAPAFGVSAFDPIEEGVMKKTVNNSMLLAGKADLIARASKVEEIAAASNGKKKNSSVFVDIERGLHAGFEDQLVILRYPLDTILSFVLDLNFRERIFLKFIFNTFFNTGQLEGSELLMQFFFDKMAKGQKVTLADADKYLEENIKTKWDKKFEFSYPTN
jgi:hypothetical protein